MLNMKSSNLYLVNFKKFGIDPKSLLWKTRGAAHQRFRQFWAEIDFSGKKVLDIGCGFGEFGHFLLKRYKNVDYTGIDIMPEFIEAAKDKVPDGKFFVADYLKDDINSLGVLSRVSPKSTHEGATPALGLPAARHPFFDVVIASGVLNSNKGDQNLEFRKKAIKKMFSLTSHILAFNMLGGHPAPVSKADSNVWYADSLEVLSYCLTLTPRVILRANYHPKDFTIVMYKLPNEKNFNIGRD